MSIWGAYDIIWHGVESCIQKLSISVGYMCVESSILHFKRPMVILCRGVHWMEING